MLSQHNVVRFKLLLFYEIVDSNTSQYNKHAFRKLVLKFTNEMTIFMKLLMITNWGIVNVLLQSFYVIFSTYLKK
jgi:hypothetical protein